MTILLFHGDNQVESRRGLKNTPVIGELRELDGTKLLPKDLETILGTNNLFSSETLLIENLFSRLKSKDKDSCIALLASYSGDKQILIWEKKELTKATLSKLPKSWKISLSKLPSILFTFLDALYPSNAKNALSLLHDLVSSGQEPIIIHTMISRHISNLIIAFSATTPKLPPWQLGKLKSQAGNWSEAKLIHFHEELLRIDYQIKTGQTKLDYISQLDLLISGELG